MGREVTAEDIVYLVEVHREGYPRHHAVFSTLDMATDWMKKQLDKAGCLCMPLIMDDPRYFSVKENVQ